MLKKIIMLSLVLGTFAAFAHEGHDQAPGTIKANHGGTVKSGKQLNLEYVVSGTEVKLFLASHAGEDLATDSAKITATSKLPKGKAEPIKVEFKEGSFVALVDFKNAYRVELNVEVDLNGKKSQFKLQIEK